MRRLATMFREISKATSKIGKLLVASACPTLLGYALTGLAGGGSAPHSHGVNGPLADKIVGATVIVVVAFFVYIFFLKKK